MFCHYLGLRVFRHCLGLRMFCHYLGLRMFCHYLGLRVFRHCLGLRLPLGASDHFVRLAVVVLHHVHQMLRGLRHGVGLTFWGVFSHTDSPSRHGDGSCSVSHIALSECIRLRAWCGLIHSGGHQDAGSVSVSLMGLVQ